MSRMRPQYLDANLSDRSAQADVLAVGAIAGAAYILARRSLVDIATVTIAVVTLTVLMLTKKIPEPVVILVAGVAGLFCTVGCRDNVCSTFCKAE